MKPIDILSALPEWAKASPETITASPAWAMPCRLGSTQCTMRLDAVRPAETLDLAVRFEDEEHVLSIAASPAFPELSAIWPSRADVPEPILLALVERDCGEFLQLLENAVRRQLHIVGLANSSPAEGAQTIFGQINLPDAPIVFALDMSPAIFSALGQLRCIDTSHESIRGERLPAEVEYASFALQQAEISSISSGDMLLVPETATVPPRVIVAERLRISDTGVDLWRDDGLLRVCAVDGGTVELGAVFDADSDAAAALPPPPAENTPLKLVRSGQTIATGRLGTLSGQNAFVAD